MITRAAAALIVTSAYHEILRRQPDAEGERAFIEALCNGDLTSDGLVSQLFNSPERQAHAEWHLAREATISTAAAAKPPPQQLTQDAAGELVLDGDFSAAPSEWDAFLGQLFYRTLHASPLRRRPAFDHLRLVLEVIDTNAENFARSLHAITGVCSAADFLVDTCVIWGGADALPNVLAQMLDMSGLKAEHFMSTAEARRGWSSDDLVMWLQSGDAPRPEIAPALAAYVDPASVVVSWDSYFSDMGRVHPVLHPGANPMLTLNVDSLFSRFACRARVLDDIVTAAEDDPIALLRGWLVTRPASELWSHIPLPLMQLNIDRGEILLQRQASIAETRTLRTERTGRDISTAQICIVICTKDKGHLLLQLVQSLTRLPAERLADIVIVSNNTTNPYANQTLADLRRLPKVRIIEYNQRFNFSAQSNLGAREGSGDYVLMLNDDVTPITVDWLDRLLEPFADPDVGVVGPLLLYPDERVQHAGMFVGFNSCAGHALRFSRLPEDDYMFHASAPREVSVVTGAVMLISRACFNALNGFDELLASYLQDVDMCLRAQRSGFKIIFTPASKLFHMESASVSAYIADQAVTDNRGREHAYFACRWGSALNKDAFHNPMFSKSDESLRGLTSNP